jgi:Arc/MetJ-type ribon-helix-helix transcriptional regulator
MGTLVQKKVSLTREHKHFIENYRKWGFSDQSSIIREALNRFIRELESSRRKALMAQKAEELLSNYTDDRELTAFTALDGEDFV